METGIQGSLGVASAFQLTEDMQGLDKQGKKMLMYKEVLAVILQETVEEYEGYSTEEVMNFIEADSIVAEQEVSNGRTNTKIEGAATEFAELMEKASNFDVSFRARNPKLSDENVLVNLYVDVEPQKDYKPGYPIEKRGIYYLARRLSAQLDVLTDKTNYGQLEKCYSIWICRDNIPKKEQMSISFYKIRNYRNIGSCRPREKDYDLLHLVIIRLGDEDYQCEDKNVLDFLTMIFYSHKEGFRKKIAKYIDVEDVLQELQEDKNMGGLEEIYYSDGLEAGRTEGRAEGSKDATRVIVRNMLKRKMSVADICALAECNREFVEEVRKGKN